VNRFFYVGRIWGRPVPYRLQTYRGRMTEDARSREWKKAARVQFQESISRPYLGPLRMIIVASWPLPKNRNTDAEGWGRTAKPDGSNILKAVEDAMNEIVFVDDQYLVRSEAVKVYTPAKAGSVTVFCGDPKSILWMDVERIVMASTLGKEITEEMLVALHKLAWPDLT